MASTQPKPGDLIEVFRAAGYRHWAVYIADGFVIHLTIPSERAVNVTGKSSISGKGIVKKEKLVDVVGSNEWRVNNILDHKYTPRSPEVIVKEAEKRVGEDVHYDFLSQNCEHFATELRYGKAESSQSNSLANAAIAAVETRELTAAVVSAAPTVVKVGLGVAAAVAAIAAVPLGVGVGASVGIGAAAGAVATLVKGAFSWSGITKK